MADPFDIPGDAQAGAGQSCPQCGMGGGKHDSFCPVALTIGAATLEAMAAARRVAPKTTAPVGGPVIDAVVRNAARRFVTDTLSPRRFVGVEDVAFADLHRLAAAVGSLVAGWRVWDALGLTIRPDFAEFWALRLESVVDKDAVAAVISRELLALVQPLVEGPGAMPTAAPAPHLLGEAARCPVPRSPHWPAVRDKWLREHPNCTACDATDGVEVHHAVAVHMDRSRELDPTIFVSLCRPRGCHFRCGHGYDWQAIVPTVRADAAHQLALAQGRLYALPPRTDGPTESPRAAGLPG